MQQLKKFVFHHHKKILWLSIIAYCLIITGLLAFKYNTFGYNAIDLAIYNQVFYNSVQGDLWQLTIHPHLYLGDHFELFILLLMPFYFIFSSPYTLIFIQTLFIALSAWPIFLIARNKLNRNWSLLIALAFLLNPFILNINFFEFHILAFAIFFLLFTFYFYQKNRFWPYLIFMLISLLIREDVSLVIIMFGLLAIIEKKKIKWSITPIILGGAWFIIAFNLTGYFNQSGEYKFLANYGWLGSNFTEITKNFFTKPLLIIKQVVSFNNLFSILGLILPLAGLPLLKIKYFIPALLIIMQLFLLKASTTIVLQTHYPSLIIPFVFIAAIYAGSSLASGYEPDSKVKNLILQYKQLFSIILIVAVIYSFLTFSPILSSLNSIIKNQFQADSIQIKKELSQSIDNEDAVLASFEFLPPLSNRPNLYSLHYAWLGKKQFSDEPYQVPAITNKLLIDFNDFLIYYLQSKNMSTYKQQYSTGAARINQFIEKNNFGLKTIIDNYALYEKNYQPDIVLVEQVDSIDQNAKQTNINLDGQITLLAWSQIDNAVSSSYQILPIDFYWLAHKNISEDYQLELIIKDSQNKTVYQKLYPLGYGLYPTSQWPNSQIIKTHHQFLIPSQFNLDDIQLYFQLVSISGFMDLNGVRSATMEITEQKNIGPIISFPYRTL